MPARTWRDVTLAQYRRWTALSTLGGVIAFAFGLYLVFHRELVLGLILVLLGSGAGLWTVALRIDGTPGPLYRAERVHEELWSPRVLQFYTREGCSICREARLRLDLDLAGKDITVVEHDVDRDPVLQRRYGDRVPVAVFAGGEVFALQYDATAVRAL